MMPFVYLLHNSDTSWHKVGATNDVRLRVLEISRAEPGELRLIWAIATNNALRLESYFKRLWVLKNQRGEWFHLSDEDVRQFCSVSCVNYLDDDPVPEGYRDPLPPRRNKHGAHKRYTVAIGEVIRRVRYAGKLRHGERPPTAPPVPPPPDAPPPKKGKKK